MTDDNMPDVQLEETGHMKKAEWNKAIEACMSKLKTDFVAPDVVCGIIRKLKK